MPTIMVYGPEYSRQWVRDIPGLMYGVRRLTYQGTGVYCVGGDGTSVNPGDVAAVIDRLQDVLPLGLIGDYEILVTDRQLLAAEDPVGNYAEAVRLPGWIALSYRTSTDLFDLLAHEIAHELEHHLSPEQLAVFWQLVGEGPGDRGGLWHLRPQERFAEYISAAIWRVPIAAVMPQLGIDVLDRIRAWAKPILSRGSRAQVVLDTGEATPQRGIVLTIGSRTAIVDGQEVTIDVAPQLVDGRTLAPVRFIAEALGRRVSWDETKRQVIIN